IVGSLSGTVAGHPGLSWSEGIGVQLEWADARLWLVIEPRTLFDGLDDTNKHSATDFARERTVRRYNRQLNELIDFWAGILFAEGKEIRAMEIGDGVDAVFKLGADTAFSWRNRV